ncbi:MAG: hypothetical protein KGJ44_06335 [Betaproteobacteria bacterium]|nr:hypothetical protein [Betaproteobacteria bacterium]
MLLVAIAWLYVVVLMAVTETSVAAALATLIFFGVLPLSVVLYLMSAPARARARKRREAAERAGPPSAPPPLPPPGPAPGA